jgi:predicted transglutaminase-like cysteine proteinase
MRVGATLAGVLASFAFLSVGALAADTKKNSAVEYGKTLPPIGFVKFCASSPADCEPKASNGSIPMTPERWKLVSQVNAYVNGKIAPVSDQDLYGEPEHWAYPTDAGDCEDYVLLKKRYLEKLGFSREALLITVALDEKKEGHAILTLATESGDYILDNRNNDLLRWNSTNYKLLKRQSHKSPLEWVALVKQNPSSGNIVFGGN